jgi:endonuclease/exonuclease/phosphatase family metal-dependent hydrolase
VHAPTEDKSDDIEGYLYEELERVFNQFPKYHMKILLEDFNAKIGREGVFKPTLANESLLKISDDNGVRIVNYASSTNLIGKSTTFPHRNICTYTWTSPDRRTHNQTDHILIDKRRDSNSVDVRSFRGADCDSDHYLLVAKVRDCQ